LGQPPQTPPQGLSITHKSGKVRFDNDYKVRECESESFAGLDEAPSKGATCCVARSLRYSPYIKYGSVSSVGRALHLTPFDDANVNSGGSSNPSRLHPAHLGEGAGLYTLRLKLAVFNFNRTSYTTKKLLL
jgi:hypothetical protein